MVDLTTWYCLIPTTMKNKEKYGYKIIEASEGKVLTFKDLPKTFVSSIIIIDEDTIDKIEEISIEERDKRLSNI